MQPHDPQEEYVRRRDERGAAMVACDGRHGVLGVLRVGVFLAGLGVAGAAFFGGWLSGWWVIGPAVAFFWLGGRMQGLEGERERLARAVAFYERGLARLAGRWVGAGEGGERFLDEHHVYARDLDLFGEGSLFELICQARTRMGEETLARWLLGAAPRETVVGRQEAVGELATRLRLREDLAVVGEGVGAGVHPVALAAWSERPAVLEPTGFRLVAGGLSVLGALAVLAGIVYLASWYGLIVLDDAIAAGLRAYFLAAALLLGTLTWRFKARTDRVLHEAAEAAHDLDLLAGVLGRLEVESFEAPRLAALRAALDAGGHPPSERIARLDRLIDMVDSRDNVAVRIIGPLLLWDLHLAYALEGWRQRSGPAMRAWLHAVGEMEALSSLAGYHYERPADVFPEMVAEGPCFAGEGLGHPLLAEEALVRNDVALGPEARVLVVSGSNMSGKSTLLRTAGINAVLAQAGAPVTARRLRLSPLQVGASIRIVDSLREGTSRFYAEITRLRAIVEMTGGAEPVLFLVDELLHGTNSHDRELGAEAIVRGLVERGAIGLVTTHDLALTRIVAGLAPRGANVHFEDHLEDGRMSFDYRLRPGAVEKSNALELMRSVGLEV